MPKGISIIVAYDNNRLIGSDNELPWYLPADLKRFKELTTGNAVIMGRKTYESIGRPLPSRRNIILTKQPGFEADGCQVAHSLEEALKMGEPVGESFVIGGAEVYKQALPLANKLYITHIHAELEGQVYFPALDMNNWLEVWRQSNLADKSNPYNYTFINYEKSESW